MSKCVLKCFGVADGRPCSQRKQSAYLYQLGQVSVLIDCGEPIANSLKTTGIDFNAIDRIVLSHLHFDHIGGFFMLMQGFWLEGRRKDLVVHLPVDGIEPIRQLMRAANIFEELLGFRLRFEALRDGVTIVHNDVRIIPVNSTHLATLQRSFAKKYPLAYEAFSFVLESDQLRIGHSADIGGVDDLRSLTEVPLDMLVCELAHTRPEELFPFLRQRPIKRILFTHLSNDLWEDLEQTRRLARQALNGMPFSFACDGEEVFL